jgi:outer membrane protein TolC
MALSEGTQARLARSGEERARIARREALDAMLPQANANLLRYNQSLNLETFGFTLPGLPPIIGPFNVTDAQVTAEMQLFNLAALRAYQSRTTGVDASRYDVERAENDVAAAVARLYVLVARAEAQVNSREADVKLFTELARVAKDELDAGTGTRLDVAQANVQLARAKQALLSARNDRETARLALLNTIGADESSEVILSDAFIAPANIPETPAAIASARAQRPDLKALEAQERSAQLFVEAQKDRRLPSISLDFAGDYSGNHSTDLLWSRRIAAMASMPIFRGDINSAIARAKVDLEDAHTRHNAAQRDVEQEVRSSLLTVQNANARVAVASENVKVAEEALTIARDRRSAGYGSPVEVDRAEDVYRQAHEDLISAQADAAMAWYSLQHATGDIRNLFGAPAQ